MSMYNAMMGYLENLYDYGIVTETEYKEIYKRLIKKTKYAR